MSARRQPRGWGMREVRRALALFVLAATALGILAGWYNKGRQKIDHHFVQTMVDSLVVRRRAHP